MTFDVFLISNWSPIMYRKISFFPVLAIQIFLIFVQAKFGPDSSRLILSDYPIDAGLANQVLKAATPISEYFPRDFR